MHLTSSSFQADQMTSRKNLDMQALKLESHEDVRGGSKGVSLPFITGKMSDPLAASLKGVQGLGEMHGQDQVVTGMKTALSLKGGYDDGHALYQAVVNPRLQGLALATYFEILFFSGQLEGSWLLEES